ncbi:MAG: serine hydrolase [Bacteroidia bacterium]
MKLRTTTLLLLSILFSLSQAFSQTHQEQYDAILAEQFPADGPGGSAIVVKDGKVEYLKAFGKANLELDVTMKPQHIFRIGSITKQFTACAILRLVEAGKLSVDDPITKFIPDYPTHGKTITVEHLLTHTSGIQSYTGMEKWDGEVRKQDFTPTEMIDYFKEEPMEFDPGENYHYNNSGYFLLGYIIEKVSGKTYAEHIESTFFGPLGMKHSSYGNFNKIVPNRAAGYQQDNNGAYQNADFLSMTQPYAAGSLLSNVEDLSIWYHAVMSGKVISKESLKKAHTSYKLNNGEETNYGYGWSISTIQKSPRIQHGGGINGFLTASMFLPEEKVFVAVFSNCNCVDPGSMANKIAAIAIDKPYPSKAIQVSAEALAEYQAVYESEEGAQRVITEENGQLFSVRDGGQRFEVYPYEKDKFFFEGGVTTLEFKRSKKGKIESVTSISDRETVSWKRTKKDIPVETFVKVDEALLARYVGNYQLGPGFIIAITLEDGSLFAQATGQQKIELKALSDDTFKIVVVNARIVFNLDGQEKAASLTLFQNGENKAMRVD